MKRPAYVLGWPHFFAKNAKNSAVIRNDRSYWTCDHLDSVAMTAIKIYTVAFVPGDLHQAYLQHLRDFDVAHPGCHFEIMVDVPDLSLKEMVERMRIDPALTFQQIIERKRE